MGVYQQERYPWIACQLGRLEKRLDCRAPDARRVPRRADDRAGARRRGLSRAGQGDRLPSGSQVRDAADNPLRHVAGTPVLHWHGDTFTLPERRRTARLEPISTRTRPFRRGNNILALQFHAEMGLDPRFEEWLERWGDHVNDAGQDADDLRALHGVLGPPAVAAGQAMIADWLEAARPEPHSSSANSGHRHGSGPPR